MEKTFQIDGLGVSDTLVYHSKFKKLIYTTNKSTTLAVYDFENKQKSFKNKFTSTQSCYVESQLGLSSELDFVLLRVEPGNFCILFVESEKLLDLGVNDDFYFKGIVEERYLIFSTLNIGSDLGNSLHIYDIEKQKGITMPFNNKTANITKYIYSDKFIFNGMSEARHNNYGSIFWDFDNPKIDFDIENFAISTKYVPELHPIWANSKIKLMPGVGYGIKGFAHVSSFTKDGVIFIISDYLGLEKYSVEIKLKAIELLSEGDIIFSGIYLSYDSDEKVLISFKLFDKRSKNSYFYKFDVLRKEIISYFEGEKTFDIQHHPLYSLNNYGNYSVIEERNPKENTFKITICSLTSHEVQFFSFANDYSCKNVSYDTLIVSNKDNVLEGYSLV